MMQRQEPWARSPQKLERKQGNGADGELETRCYQQKTKLIKPENSRRQIRCFFFVLLTFKLLNLSGKFTCAVRKGTEKDSPILLW